MPILVRSNGRWHAEVQIICLYFCRSLHCGKRLVYSTAEVLKRSVTGKFYWQLCNSPAWSVLHPQIIPIWTLSHCNLEAFRPWRSWGQDYIWDHANTIQIMHLVPCMVDMGNEITLRRSPDQDLAGQLSFWGSKKESSTPGISGSHRLSIVTNFCRSKLIDSKI